MTKLTIVAAAMAMMAAGSVGAQTGSANVTAPTPAMGKATTYTGCVAAGPQKGTYMLTKMSSDMGTKKNTMTPASMTLVGKVDFSKHVGHKVSVTGVMGEVDGMGTEAAMPRGSLPLNTLNVMSMKMMGMSCGT